jgi:hypothetical protein
MAPGPTGASRIPLILAVVALLLGASAIGLALINSAHTGPAGANGAAGTNGTAGPRGPAGATGATGSQGPAGPGAVMNQTSFTGTGNALAKTCGSMDGMELNLTATRAGHAILTAEVLITLTHTTGGNTADYLNIGNTSTDCTGVASYALVTSAEPTGSYYVEVGIVQDFTIPAAGTYSFFITGYDYSSGTDTTNFGWANLVGVYYPS